MRFKLCFTLENEMFPIQYRKSILSFIKLSLSEYNPEYYEKFYHDRDNIVKPFCFAVFFHHPQFLKDKIIIEDKRIELNISVDDYNTGVILYNAFNKQKYKKFLLDSNSMTLLSISLMKEKEILQNAITIKFQSPLVVRDRNKETRKDYHYSYSHTQFEDVLKRNMKEQMKLFELPEEIVDTFHICSIAPKKTVVKFYEKQIECSLGVFQLIGEIPLLTHLYQAGIGSKRSSRIWYV